MTVSDDEYENLSERISNEISIYNKTPKNIQQVAYDALEYALDGVDIVDPTSPFTYLLEVAATFTSSAINEGEVLYRRMYPKLAQNKSDLYHHMSDKDYADQFSTPSKADINLLIPFDELKKYSVALTTNSEIKTVIIPRDVKITKDDVNFGIYYPIIIEINDNGTVHARYDDKSQNPLKLLSTNVLPNRKVLISGITYLELTLEMEQFNTVSAVYPVDNTGYFKQNISYNDQFLYARVFHDLGNSKWTEIKTTHTDLIYDSSEVTAVLRVKDGTVEIELPDIYQTNQTIGTSVRVDVYTTKGKYEEDLSLASSDSFSAVWKVHDTYADLSSYIPLDRMADMIIYSTDKTYGGRNEKTFDELRKQVVYHKYRTDAPIRESDIVVGLEDKGYSVSRLRNTITQRLYLAVKELPPRVVNSLVSNSFIFNDQVSIKSNLGNTGNGYSTYVKKHINGNITLTEWALYRLDENGINILADAVHDNINALTKNALVNELNRGIYFYSPFTYVIDLDSGGVEARAYSMAYPTLTNKLYGSHNKNLDYTIETQSVLITASNGEYLIDVTARIPKGLEGVGAQIRHVNSDTLVPSYLMPHGIVINNDNAVISFKVETDYDIDDNGYIELTNMTNTIGLLGKAGVLLEDLYDIFYYVEEDNDIVSDFDSEYNDNLITVPVTMVKWEKLKIRLGTELEHLYCPVDVSVATPTYETYTSDVPATHTTPKYEEVDGVFTYTIVDGDVVLNKIADVGDPLLDSENNPVYDHLAGDIVVDENGRNVLASGEEYVETYIVGLVLTNAMYRYSNTEEMIGYYNAIPESVVEYISKDVRPESELLHELTNIYYSPKGSLKDIVVDLGNDTLVSVPPALTINATIYLNRASFIDDGLRDNFVTIMRTYISEELNSSTFSPSSIINKMLSLPGSHIKGIDISDENDNSLKTMRLVNETDSFSIKEVLTVNQEGLIDVEDQVTISFKEIN